MSDRLESLIASAASRLCEAPHLFEALLECMECDGRQAAMGPWRGSAMRVLEDLGVVEGCYARGVVTGWVPTDIGRRTHQALLVRVPSIPVVHP